MPDAKRRSAGARGSVKAKARPVRPGGEGTRAVRAAAQLRQEIARVVARELADPRLEGLVVSRAWMSPDLRVAKIYFRLATTSVGAELAARREAATKALQKATGRLKSVVTQRLELRVAPELRFMYDEGQEARDRIEELLEEVKRER
jgi:ribosome-binding factor A